MWTRLLGIVDNASEHGFQIDEMMNVVHWVMALLFIGWGTFFVFTLIRFRKARNPKADYHGARSHASSHLEFTVVLAEAVLLLGFAIPMWARRANGPPPAQNAERIRVVAEQFRWNFHYPGPDGKFGRQRADLISALNPLGIDPADEAGKDDFVSSNEVHLPLNKDVILDITSKDVIHSFALHPMRIGQDAIPGTSSPVWFRPIKSGEYELVCGQLCGSGHYAMRAAVVVDPPDAYADWLKEMRQLKAASSHTAK